MSELIRRFQSCDPLVLERELTGFPPGTLEAALRFQRDPDPDNLRRVLPGFINHHLPAGMPKLDGPPADDAHLVRDLGLDSLALSEMAFKMEDLFGITVASREIVDLGTVGDLVDFILAKLGLPPS